MNIIRTSHTAEVLTTRSRAHALYDDVWGEIISAGKPTLIDLRDMRLAGKSFLDGLTCRIRDNKQQSLVAFATESEREKNHLRKLAAICGIEITVITAQGRTAFHPDPDRAPETADTWTDPLAEIREHPLVSQEMIWAAPAIGETTDRTIEDFRKVRATARLFSPTARWTWHIAEIDERTGMCFGLVDGNELEWGLFELDSLASARLPNGMPHIRRDLMYAPETMGDIYDRLNAQRKARPGRFPPDDPDYPGILICPGCGGPDDAHYPDCLPPNQQNAARTP